MGVDGFMIKINIYAVGTIKEQFYKDSINEFLKRLSKFAKVEIIETQEVKIQNENNSKEVLDKEAEYVLKHLKDNDYLILIDLHGKEMDSIEFSKEISNLIDAGKSPINFAIGGTLGFGEKLINRANKRICLSKLTFTHQMTRIILLEQIYRSFKIINNEPYHH